MLNVKSSELNVAISRKKVRCPENHRTQFSAERKMTGNGSEWKIVKLAVCKMHMHSSLETRGTSAPRIHNNTVHCVIMYSVWTDKKVVVVFNRHGPQNKREYNTIDWKNV